MAGSRLLPLTLALLLFARTGDSSVVLTCTGVAFTLLWESVITNNSPSPTTESTQTTSDPSSQSPEITPESTSPSLHPTSLETTSSAHSSSNPTSLEATSSAHSSSNPTTGSASPEPETASFPSSVFPSSEPTTTPQFTNLAPQGSPTTSSPGQDAGSLWIPTSHRNPGVVTAVCLLVSVLLIGSVFIAVRHFNRDLPAFHNLDTVSMVRWVQAGLGLLTSQ
ncbi:salivary glue protein Sgs-3-like [Rattus rattus]|uniref:salivary glue protein Sgs-3-like n=1 Tax=Rattus rattus TaxID=10117 RepID=UPI0013F2DFF3|nr:salivary glue protein Sgs-3-like [Rattus rattus]